MIHSRNNLWLTEELDDLWQKHFSDIQRRNSIEIKFGRNCRTRLGSIRMSRDKKKSTILINGLFKDFYVPKEVIRATIVHELTHYAQGFSSPLPKQGKYPHRGGIVKKELQDRGLFSLMHTEKQWLKQNWFPFVKARMKKIRKSRSRYLLFRFD